MSLRSLLLTSGIIPVPKTISGLSLWLDGTDPAGTGTPPSSGTAISSWVDKSGKGNNFTQSTPGNQPTYQSAAVNSKGSIQFTELNNDYLQSVGYFMLAGSAFDFFWVLNPSTVSGNGTGYTFFYTDKGNSGTVISPNYQTPTFSITPTFFNFESFGWESSSFIQAFTANSTYLFEFNYNGGDITTSTNYTGLVNNSVLTRAGAISGGGGNGPNVLGGDALSSANYQYGGYMSEIIFYNRVLSSSERTSIQNYLFNRWNY